MPMEEPTVPAPASAPDAEPNGRGPPTPEQVFRQHAPRIYNLARRMLGSDSDAEDVTQDVLVQVIRNLDRFRGESTLGTWLHRITVNAALNHRHKRTRREEHRVDTSIDTLVEEEYPGAVKRRWVISPVEQALSEEQHRLIEEAIRQLPVAYRDVFVLADVEGLSSAGIAELLGLTVSAVKNRLHRARLLMRKALAPHFEEVPT
jgi:RNA polymerase sigma-70 factor (ECF subfamily)